MSRGPSVSPADTIRHAEEWIGDFRDGWNWPESSQGDLDRASLWTTLDEAATLAEEMAALAAALLAVGERDKAEIERLRRLVARAAVKREVLLIDGERDRRKIAQLTEVGKAALIVADVNGEMRSTYGRRVTGQEWSTALCNLEMVAIAARALVLADEEDAANG